MTNRAIYVVPSTQGFPDTRISFDPFQQVPDWRNGGELKSLFELYSRDVREGAGWIEDPDGFYIVPPLERVKATP